MGTYGGVTIERAWEIDLWETHLRAGILSRNNDAEPFLLRPAEPHLRAIVKALFLTRPYLLPLQVGAGIARQGLITQVYFPNPQVGSVA